MNDRKWFVILAIVIIFLISLTVVRRARADTIDGAKIFIERIGV